MKLSDFYKKVKKIDNVNISMIKVDTNKKADLNIEVPNYPYSKKMKGTLSDISYQRIEPCLKQFEENYYIIIS